MPIFFNTPVKSKLPQKISQSYISLDDQLQTNLNLLLNKSDLEHDLSQGDVDLGIFFDGSTLLKGKRYPQNIKLEIYTMQNGQKSLLSLINRTIKNKKAALNVFFRVHLPRIESTADLMFDVYDSDNVLVSTFTKEIIVKSPPVVSLLETVPDFNCASIDGECLLEYMLRHVTFSANFDNSLKTQVYKNDKGRYVVNIPIKKGRKIGKKVKGFNVNGSGGKTSNKANGIANFEDGYPYFEDGEEIALAFWNNVRDAIEFKFDSTNKTFDFKKDGSLQLSTSKDDAYLNIAPGTVSKAPIVLSQGELLTSPVEGAIEYDGNNLYFTAGSSRQILGATGPAGPPGPMGPAGPAGAGGSPAGADGDIQFNSAGSLGATGNFNWNSVANNLSLSGSGVIPTSINLVNSGSLNGDLFNLGYDKRGIGIDGFNIWRFNNAQWQHSFGITEDGRITLGDNWHGWNSEVLVNSRSNQAALRVSQRGNGDLFVAKLNTGSAEQFAIDKNGFVGVHGINPTVALTVNGSFLLKDGNQANGYVLTSDANGLASWKSIGSVANGGISSSGVAGAVQFSDGAGGFDSDATNLFFDNVNGNLGIGENLPQYRVHADGVIRAKDGNDYISLDPIATNPSISLFRNGGWHTRLEANGSGLKIYGGGSGIDAIATFSPTVYELYKQSYRLGLVSHSTPVVYDAYMYGAAGAEAYKIRTFNAAGSMLDRFSITGREDVAKVSLANSNLGVGTANPLVNLDITGRNGQTTNLSEWHDFNGTTLVSISNHGSLMIKDGTQANGFILTSDVNGNSSWQDLESAINGIGLASSGSAGAIQFSDGSNGFDSDASNLSWNNTNKTLEIGARGALFTSTVSDNTDLAYNAYYDPGAGNWKRRVANSSSTMLELQLPGNQNFAFYTAVDGTATADSVIGWKAIMGGRADGVWMGANTNTNSELSVVSSDPTRKVLNLRAASNQSADIFRINDINGSNFAVMDNNGFIGFNTSNPAQKLHLENGNMHIENGRLAIGIGVGSAGAQLTIGGIHPTNNLQPALSISKPNWGSAANLSVSTLSDVIVASGGKSFLNYTNSITGTYLYNSYVLGSSYVVRDDTDDYGTIGISANISKQRLAKGANANVTIGADLTVTNLIADPGNFGYVGRFTAGSPNVTGLQINAAAAQRSNLLEIKDSANNPLVIFDNGGSLAIARSSVQNGFALDLNGSINTLGFSMPTGASNGFVMVSDANGLSSWQDLSTAITNAGLDASADGAVGRMQYSDGSGGFVSQNDFVWDSASNGLAINTTGTGGAAMVVRQVDGSGRGINLSSITDSSNYISLNADNADHSSVMIVTNNAMRNAAIGFRNNPLNRTWRLGAGYQVGDFHLGLGYPNSGAMASSNALLSFDVNGNALFGTKVTIDDTRKVEIMNSNASVTAFAIEGASQQSANLTEWQDVNGVVMNQIQADGDIQFHENKGIYFKRTGLNEYGSIVHDGQDFTINAGSWAGTDVNLAAQATVSLNAPIVHLGNATPSFYATNSSASVMNMRANSGYIFDSGYGGGIASTSFRNIGVETMEIDKNGTVGIGNPATLSSTYKLEVNGDVQFHGSNYDLRIIDSGASGHSIASSSSGTHIIFNASNVTSFPQSVVVNSSQSAIADFRVHGDINTDLIVADVSTENVGIGEPVPQRKLHVSDTMRLEPRSAAPAAAALGDIYVDSDSNELCFYDGATWTGLKAGGACI